MSGNASAYSGKRDGRVRKVETRPLQVIDSQGSELTASGVGAAAGAAHRAQWVRFPPSLRAGAPRRPASLCARELLLLREMIEAAARSQKVIGDLDAAGLGADVLRRDTLLGNYPVLGEASSQVPLELKEAHSEIGWAQAVRLRNRIVHGYWNVDLHIVHDTAREDLPMMVDQLHDVPAHLEAPAQGEHRGRQRPR